MVNSRTAFLLSCLALLTSIAPTLPAADRQSLHFLRSDSHNKAAREAVTQKLNGRKVDLLFIDRDHRYRGVKKDFTMYAPLVKAGGKEFVEPDDDRGWGPWGGLGLLFYTAEDYDQAVRRRALRAVPPILNQTSQYKRRVQQPPSLGYPL